MKNENEQSKAVETKNPSGGPEAGGATGAEDDFEGGGNEDDDDDESSSSGEDGSASEVRTLNTTDYGPQCHQLDPYCAGVNSE